MDALLQFDRDLFLSLNQLHTPWSDELWKFLTNRLTWIPLYLFLLVLLIKKYKSSVWIFLLTVILMTVVSDQGANFAKRNFQRLRPCHEPQLSQQVNVPAGCGGQFGYFSGHASNSAALSVLILLALRGTYFTFLLMPVYMILVGMSRIFLGVHYPFDIISGFVWGSLVGLLFYKLFDYSCNRWILRS
jgi:undecaprenyl-diphosphatase